MDPNTKPRYNRCDFCGRNAHKVAVRERGRVVGYCPSCFAGKVERGGFDADTVVVYDRRSERSKVNGAQAPAVARVREHVGEVVSIVGEPDGSIVVSSRDGEGNPRTHRVSPDGVPVPVAA